MDHGMVELVNKNVYLHFYLIMVLIQPARCNGSPISTAVCHGLADDRIGATDIEHYEKY